MWERRVQLALIPEEKGSDVNLATYLMLDAALGRYDSALVVTNDSDLAEPIRLVQTEFGRSVTIVHPSQFPARKLRATGADIKPLWWSTILKSQFPEIVQAPSGRVSRPSSWSPEIGST
jgi:hypothetical protein